MNQLEDCSGIPWAGTSVSAANYSWSGTTVTVNVANCCSTGTPQSSLLQTGDLIWVTGGSGGIGTGSMGAPVTVNNSGQFTYSTASSGTSTGAINYISAAQSWPVPYEYPYKSALGPTKMKTLSCIGN